MSDALALNAEADDQKLLAQVVSYYHKTLKETPSALDFLRRKGLVNGEFIEHFRVGLADRTLGLSLPPKIIKAGRQIRSRLQEVGLYRKSGHEHFNGCVIFPVTASDGSQRILDIYGRKIGGKRLRKGTPIDMYLTDQRHGVWNVESFGAGDEVILCTSLLDALTLWCHGYRNVTCTFGSDALLDDHVNSFREYHIRRVTTTCEGFSDRITEAGIDCFLLRFPNGMTVNEYASQVDHPAQKLGNIIRKAEWLAKGKSKGSKPSAPNDVAVTEHADDQQPLPDDECEIETTDGDDVSASDMTITPSNPSNAEAEVSRDEVIMNIGHRRYRVRGLARNTAFEVMKVNILVSTDRGMFVDTFDLYSARHRKAFVTQAAIELILEEQTIKKDLGRVLLKLEELQDEQISALLEPKDTSPTMTSDEKDEALQFLRDPKLLERIVSDFAVVGEETNKLVGYLAAVSRKLNDPLAVIIQSSSAAGKTSLMEAILSFVPPEDEVKFSAMTGQSLFYMGESDLKHKVLAIVEEEGADKASYALKLLQSEGELMIASTGKEAATGRLITQTYKVEGPVMIFLTTTAITIDEELMNRCIVLSVDEDREQTKAIHRLQRHRQTLDGLLSMQSHQQAIKLHRNAQRLLRPLLVANPYAESLTFQDHKTRISLWSRVMGRLSRAESCPDDEINVVHCINRCVRRGFLCGIDAVTGNDYEHRREWIRARIEFLAGAMGVEVLGYAIMSNHFHLVLRNRPDIVSEWKDDEIAVRWWTLCPARRNKDKSAAKPTQLELNAISGDKQKLKEYRTRLSSISWFMRFVTEHVARRANADDEVTGRFWEGRFKCQPLLDDAAILACLQYVDLNPIRAKIAKSIGESDFTSGQDRLEDLKRADGVSGDGFRGSGNAVEDSSGLRPVSLPSTGRDGFDRKCEHGPRAGWMAPVELEPKRQQVRNQSTKRRASNKGCLSMSMAEYLQLLDWTGRQIRRDGKLGTIPSELKPLFEQVGISAEIWVDCVRRFGKWHASGVGRPASLKRQTERTGCNRSLNAKLSQQIFA